MWSLKGNALADSGGASAVDGAQKTHRLTWLFLLIFGGMLAAVQHEERSLLISEAAPATALAAQTIDDVQFSAPYDGGPPQTSGIGSSSASAGGRPTGATFAAASGPILSAPSGENAAASNSFANPGIGPLALGPSAASAPGGGSEPGASGDGTSGGNAGGSSFSPGGGGGGSIAGAAVAPPEEPGGPNEPSEPPASPIPEPGQWALMLFGFFAIGAAMRVRSTGSQRSLATKAVLRSK